MQHKQGRGSSVDRGRKRRFYDMSWVDSNKTASVVMQKGYGKHRVYHRNEWKEERDRILDVEKMGSGRLMSYPAFRKDWTSSKPWRKNGCQTPLGSGTEE